MSIIKNSLPADNAQKFKNYGEQFTRLNLALEHEFYLEATFIAYAILEDRSESVLRHAGLWEPYMAKQGPRFPSFDSKLKFVRKHAAPESALLHKYFSASLSIKPWTGKMIETT